MRANRHNGILISLLLLVADAINRLLKEINRLLTKEMSNIYLKVTLEKN